jgi:hypothetical protein
VGVVRAALTINRCFAEGAARFESQLVDHLAKADFVPIRTAFLTRSNEALLRGMIARQSSADQARIILTR